MTNNTLEKLKHAQSTLNAERVPVSQVQEAMIQSKEITQFVQSALSKENRWIFQTGEQESIISMLSEINKTYKELYEKCRSPEHFNREIDRFLKMKNQIKCKSDCIHFSLDQGFYSTEPLGFTPRNAVEISLQKISDIHEGVKQGKWVLLPIENIVDDSVINEVKKLFPEAVSLSEKILKNNSFNSFDPPIPIEGILTLYKYFQIVRTILDLGEKVMKETLSKKSNTKTFSPDEILGNLSGFEKNINSVKMPSSNIVPDWGIELYKISRTDILLRMHLLRIPFETTSFLKKQLNNLEKQKEIEGIHKCVTNLQSNVTNDLELLQLFIETFKEIDETFGEVTGILQNLSISFGKIFHNASAQTITSTFLKKVLVLIQGMLEKGQIVADSKTQKLNILEKTVKDSNMFDPPIINGIIYSIDLLDQGKKEMNQFCQQIKSFLETLSNASEWNSSRTYKFLQKAYEKSANLTSAAMIFGSVTKTCVLLKDSIAEVESIILKIRELKDQNLETETLYEKTLEILRVDKEYSKSSLTNSGNRVEELNWLLDEMLGHGIREEQRFVIELQKELRPVITRIQSKKLKESSQKAENAIEAKEKEQKVNLRKTTSKKSTKSSPSPAVGKKSVYDPFEPFEMVAIKNACKTMTSSQGKMISHVLSNTHTFFTLLNKMEHTFKPGVEQDSLEQRGLENELVQDLEKSKTTHEFLNNFARLKFLPNGYYSNNNTQFNYNIDKRSFEIPAGVEKQLKLSPTSIGSPMEVYRRLIRVILGFDDPKTLSTIMPQQVLSILEEDLILKPKDRKIVEEKLQST